MLDLVFSTMARHRPDGWSLPLCIHVMSMIRMVIENCAQFINYTASFLKDFSKSNFIKFCRCFMINFVHFVAKMFQFQLRKDYLFLHIWKFIYNKYFTPWSISSWSTGEEFLICYQFLSEFKGLLQIFTLKSTIDWITELTTAVYIVNSD